MIEARRIKCGICGKEEIETVYGGGWPGWGELKGIDLNEQGEPHLCPEHLALIADLVDKLAEESNS